MNRIRFVVNKGSKLKDLNKKIIVEVSGIAKTDVSRRIMSYNLGIDENGKRYIEWVTDMMTAVNMVMLSGYIQNEFNDKLDHITVEMD